VKLPRTLPSTLGINSKVNLSSKARSKIIQSIEKGLRIQDSNSKEIVTTQKEVLEIGNLSTASIEYGRILVDLASLINYESLVRFGEILRSDRSYLEGNNIHNLEISHNASLVSSEVAENLSLRLKKMEEWLGMN